MSSKDPRKSPSEIEDKFLFLGDSVHGTEIEMQKQLGITHLVNAANDNFPKLKEFKGEIFSCNVQDHPKADLSQYFEKVFEFVENARKSEGKVLIFCGEGVSRSCTLTAAYLLQKSNISLSECLLFIRMKRYQANPNNGFVRQLISLEKKLRGTTSMIEVDFEDDWGFGCYSLYQKELKKYVESQNSNKN